MPFTFKKITTMDIRELLMKAFNKDLPISGGMENSIEEAVVLESAGPLNDYVSLEYQFMDLISQAREPLHLEYHYFDITKCINVLSDEDQRNNVAILKMNQILQ